MEIYRLNLKPDVEADYLPRINYHSLTLPNLTSLVLKNVGFLLLNSFEHRHNAGHFKEFIIRHNSITVSAVLHLEVV